MSHKMLLVLFVAGDRGLGRYYLTFKGLAPYGAVLSTGHR